MGPRTTALSEAERIARTLYRRDAAQLALVEPCVEVDSEFFQERGYLAFEGMLSTEEVESATAALTDVLHGRVEGKVGRQEEPFYVDGQADERVTDPELRVRKLWSFCKVEPRLASVAAHERIKSVLDRLIEPGSRMIQDMALVKPPYHGSEKPWHQDTAYFDYLPLGGIVGVWIALDPAT